MCVSLCKRAANRIKPCKVGAVSSVLAFDPNSALFKRPSLTERELCQFNGALCHSRQAKRCSACLCSAVPESGLWAISATNTLRVCVCVCVGWPQCMCMCVCVYICGCLLMSISICSSCSYFYKLHNRGKTLFIQTAHRVGKDTFSKATLNVQLSFMHTTTHQTHTSPKIIPQIIEILIDSCWTKTTSAFKLIGLVWFSLRREAGGGLVTEKRSAGHVLVGTSYILFTLPTASSWTFELASQNRKLKQ